MLKKIVAAAWFCALTIGLVHAAPALAGAATGMVSLVADNGEDPVVTRQAKRMFTELRTGKIDRKQFSAVAVKALTPEAVTEVSHMLAALGVVRQFRFVEIQRDKAGAPSSLYVIRCKNGTIHYAFGLNAAGKIDVFAFQ